MAQNFLITASIIVMKPVMIGFVLLQHKTLQTGPNKSC